MSKTTITTELNAFTTSMGSLLHFLHAPMEEKHEHIPGMGFTVSEMKSVDGWTKIGRAKITITLDMSSLPKDLGADIDRKIQEIEKEYRAKLSALREMKASILSIELKS